jgi:hypothetical protein
VIRLGPDFFIGAGRAKECPPPCRESLSHGSGGRLHAVARKCGGELIEVRGHVQRGEGTRPQTGACLPASSGSVRPVFSGVVDSPGSAPGSACPGVPLLAGLVLVLAGLARLVSVAVVLAVPVMATVALALLEMASLELEPTSLVLGRTCTGAARPFPRPRAWAFRRAFSIIVRCPASPGPPVPS